MGTKLKAYAKSIVDLFFVPRLKADKRMLDRLEDVSDLLPVLCRYRGRGTIVANQDPQELWALCEKLQEKPPRVVVEIGTAKGGTLYLWTRISAPGALIVSIDKPGEVGSVGRPTLSLYRRFGRERGIQIFTIAADSHCESAQRQLRRILGERKVDFLFIDGDHRYEGVKADFYGYQAYLGPHSIVALHDVAMPHTHPEIQVGRFWSEIQDQKLITQSLISRPGKTPGIGLTFLD
jgi:cephalosporin hydroxylase